MLSTTNSINKAEGRYLPISHGRQRYEELRQMQLLSRVESTSQNQDTRYKHNVDLGDRILNQIPGHTLQIGIHPRHLFFETAVAPI